MYIYILTFVLAWIGVKLVGYVWSYVQTCRTLATVPKFEPQHWFWGFLYKASTVTEFTFLVVEYVRQQKVRMLTAWNMVFYPLVIVVDSSTMRQVLTAKNVPKNSETGGGYSMFKPWIGEHKPSFTHRRDIAWTREGLLVSNGKKWERSRRLLTPAFHFDILKGYVEDFNSVADTLTTKLKELSAGGESVDVSQPVSRATLDSMLRCTLSYNDDNVQNIQCQHPYLVAVNRLSVLLEERWMNLFLHPDWIFNRTAQGREFKSNCDYVHKFSADIIAKRKQELETGTDVAAPGKGHLDFVDILLTAKDSDGEGLTDQEIRDEVDTFVFEGHDTTASAISWTLYAIAKYPEMQQQVRQEVNAILDTRSKLDIEDLSKLQYTTCFIKESMRTYPPVPGAERMLCEPLEMDGVKLQPGQRVLTPFIALHHNPLVWDDPEEFQPDRFLPDNIKDKDPYSFLPFSAGQRNCIGQHFAMNEIKVLIAKIVSRFELSVDAHRTPVQAVELVLRAKDGLYVHLKPRQH